MNMTKIVNWLRSIELLAGNIYLEASNKFDQIKNFPLPFKIKSG